MSKNLKTTISYLMAFVMILTSIMPTSIPVFAAGGATLKEAIANSGSDVVETMNAKEVNKLSMNITDDTVVTYSSKLSTSGSAVNWVEDDLKPAEKERLGKPIAGTLDASAINGSDNAYWIKYSNLEMGEKTYDLTVSVESAHGKISGADGPYISFFKKSPSSIRYSGYKNITVVYTITDSGQNSLSSNWVGNMTFWDIDSYQALEIRNPGKIIWAGLGKDSQLKFNMPESRIPDDSVKNNIVYCPVGNDAPDGASGPVAQQYALYTRVKLTPSSNAIKIRYFAGGATGEQTNGIFLSFDGKLPEDRPNLVIEPNITKKVNGQDDITLATPADAFEYTLSSTNGNGIGSAIEVFGWKDTLESALEFAGTPSVTRTLGGETSDVTGWFDISSSGQNISAYVRSEHLTDEDMNGTFTLHFNAKVKDGSDLSKYYDTGRNYAVIPNSGSVEMTQVGREKRTVSSNVVNVRIPLAELTVDKIADKYEYKVGDTVNYTITVKDVTVNATAYKVALNDTIPSGLQIKNVSVSGITATHNVSGQDIAVSAASLAPGQAMTVNVSCTALEDGNAKELYNAAQATCWNIKNASGHADDDAETYVNSTSLSVDKTMDKYEYEIGEKATFTIKVRNTGKGIANDVVVTDDVPEGMTLDYDSVTISGLSKTIEYSVAGTADPTNQLNGKAQKSQNLDYTEEKETRNITTKKEKSGENGWQYTINHIPAGEEATITFTATANEKGNGKESQNVVTAACNNAETVKDDAEFYINSADLSITKKYVNPYKEEKKDNRVDNEFRVYEEATGNELVKYVVEVTSSGVEGTVAKDVLINDLTLPDGMILNYDDIKIVETAKDGSKIEFTTDGGDGKTFKYHVAGTPDVTNQLNEDKYNETEDRTPVITLSKVGNGWKLTDSYMEDGSKLTITYTAKATEDVNGMEVVNTAKATAANIVKENGAAKVVKADALVYINSPRLVITKKADSDKYAVGDTVTYTIDVSNRQTGTIARNLVFTDDILTEGVKLQKTTIALLDSDGRVIKETEENYDSDIQNNQFKLTTKKHLVKPENYSQWDIANGKTPEVQGSWNPQYIGVTKETSMRIEYQMIITDKDLAGKQIDNVATAVSDEALEVTTDESITPNPPNLKPDKTADKKVYYYGEEVSYHISVNQTRESVTAKDVQIKDQFAVSDYMKIKEDSFVVKLNDQDITKDVTLELNEAKDGFLIKTGVDMEDSDVITVDYVAIPRTDAIGQDVTNTVLTWGSNAPQKQATEVIKVKDPAPELKIEKTSDKDVYSLGETGHYTVTVTQTADNATARNVVIKDAMEIPGTLTKMIPL